MESLDDHHRKSPTWSTDHSYPLGSAGRGRWRGSNGIIRDYRMTTDIGSGQANSIASLGAVLP